MCWWDMLGVYNSLKVRDSVRKYIIRRRPKIKKHTANKRCHTIVRKWKIQFLRQARSWHVIIPVHSNTCIPCILQAWSQQTKCTLNMGLSTGWQNVPCWVTGILTCGGCGCICANACSGRACSRVKGLDIIPRLRGGGVPAKEEEQAIVEPPLPLLDASKTQPTSNVLFNIKPQPPVPVSTCTLVTRLPTPLFTSSAPVRPSITGTWVSIRSLTMLFSGALRARSLNQEAVGWACTSIECCRPVWLSVSIHAHWWR